jgi:hypothetical protein
MAKGTTPAKKSATTELVLGQAAQNITKAVAELKTATESVNKLGTLGEELTLLVANKEEAIAALDVEFAEKKRQKEVELELDFKASKENVVTSFLNEQNKVAVAKSDLVSLQKELSDTKANADAVTKKEVAIVAHSLKSQYENEIKLIQSENNTKSVENTSKIGTLTEQKTFLEQQVTKLYQQLDAERAAGTERAKAGSVGSINVGSDNRK